MASGTTSEKDDVSGTITIPEVAHDTEGDEFVVCPHHLPANLKRGKRGCPLMIYE
jgi:hypothetical protein